MLEKEWTPINNLEINEKGKNSPHRLALILYVVDKKGIGQAVRRLKKM